MVKTASDPSEMNLNSIITSTGKKINNEISSFEINRQIIQYVLDGEQLIKLSTDNFNPPLSNKMKPGIISSFDTALNT